MDVKKYMMNDHFAVNASIELTEVYEGGATARMIVSEMHLNAGGVCQGGALFTLADLASAAVANSHEKLTLSIESNIAFFNPAKFGTVLTATAAEVRDHHKLPYIEVRITDDQGLLIALFGSMGYRKNVALPDL
jgi:acyl-CoA thioesterase